PGAGQPASRFRVETMESRVVVWNAGTVLRVPRCVLTGRRARRAHPTCLHNPCRESMQERVVRQIRMLRAMWRGPETDHGEFYTGTQGETPDTAKKLPTDLRASPRPYHGVELLVDRDLSPDAGVPRVRPRVFFPGVVAKLARLRNRVEDPQ